MTGADSRVFGVEVNPSCGGLARHIRDAVCGAIDEDYHWRTLASTAGGSLVAFFDYDPAWRGSLVSPWIAPGVRVYADNDWLLIPPSTHPGGIAHTYLDPKTPLREPPQLLIKLAFGPPPEDPVPAGKLILSRPVKPVFRPGPAHGQAVSRPDISRKGYPAFRVGGIRGKFHSSRRY